MTGAGVLQVVAILEQTRSSYLPTFLSLRKAIQQEAVVAEDNLKFLQCLEQPCHTLASATAKVGSLCMPGSKTFPSPAWLPSCIASHHVTSRHVTSRHVTSRHVTSRHVTSRHVTSRHVTSCHVMSHHIISHHTTSITPHHITPHPNRQWPNMSHHVCFQACLHAPIHQPACQMYLVQSRKVLACAMALILHTMFCVASPSVAFCRIFPRFSL